MKLSAEFARRTVKEVAAVLRRARWWILAVAVLCVCDQAIRACAFSLPRSSAVALRCARLCLLYGAFSTAPVFLCGRFSRILGPVLFGYWLLAELVQLWVLVNFNMALGGNWILMVFSTSGAEVREFASGFMTVGNILFALLSFAAVAAVARFFASPRREYPAPSRISVCLALLCLALSWAMAVTSFRAPVSWAQISRDLLALNLPADTAANWSSYHALASACSSEPRFGLSVAGGAEKGPLCVFVIGESTARSHMGIYGYRRDTTPELAALAAEGGLAVFTDLTTTHPATPEALCSLLTGCDLAASRSFPAVFPAMLKKAGYRTELVSCQGSWQNKDVVGSHLFLSCGSRRFLQGGHVAGTLPDGVALPVVEEALADASGGLALFVHLYGCHNPATRRVPKDFRRQWPRDASVASEKARRKVDSYDTAVAYDDYVVSSVIRAVAARGAPSFVFFVSDHGESPDSAIWRDAKSRDTFEVPLMVWMSPEYRAAYPGTAARVEAARSRKLYMNQLIEGMLELARVEGYRPWNSSGNFIAAEFVEAAPQNGKERGHAR